jgi:hypothetical protein
MALDSKARKWSKEELSSFDESNRMRMRPMERLFKLTMADDGHTVGVVKQIGD